MSPSQWLVSGPAQCSVHRTPDYISRAAIQPHTRAAYLKPRSRREFITWAATAVGFCPFIFGWVFLGIFFGSISTGWNGGPNHRGDLPTMPPMAVTFYGQSSPDFHPTPPDQVAPFLPHCHRRKDERTTTDRDSSLCLRGLLEK